MIISMIAAIGPKGELGLDNKLLWHIPEDLLNFKKITMGKMIVMGRKSFESIGRPLPRRENVVITRDLNFRPEGVTVLNDPMLVFDLALAREEESGNEEFEVMIIGGGEIYKFFYPYAQRIYLSQVKYSGPADTFFPEINKEEWHETTSTEFNDFSFSILERT